MASEPPSARSVELAELLQAWHRGERSALDAVLPLVADELRAIAGRYLAVERPGHTLQTAALVHEAYLRLAGQRQGDWKNRAYFSGAVATVMRRILIDHARRRGRDTRRVGDVVILPLDEVAEPSAVSGAGPGLDVEALDLALDKLGRLDPRQACIVELRYFSGMTIEEIAEVMDLPSGAVTRDWLIARAWLFAELRTAESRGSSDE
jgi:RNA polymerase sigma-70 factor (ECF subfamily)